MRQDLDIGGNGRGWVSSRVACDASAAMCHPELVGYSVVPVVIIFRWVFGFQWGHGIGTMRHTGYAVRPSEDGEPASPTHGQAVLGPQQPLGAPTASCATLPMETGEAQFAFAPPLCQIKLSVWVEWNLTFP